MGTAWLRWIWAASGDLWRFGKERKTPWYVELLLGALVGAISGAAIVVLAALLSGNLLNTRWWSPSLGASMLVGALIMMMTHACFRLLRRNLTQAQRERLDQGIGQGTLLVFLGIPTLCSAVGLVMLDVLTRAWKQGALVAPRMPSGGSLITFLFCGALFAALSWWRMRAELRAQRAHQQMSEAQLRLLQAQIEPHFLFNTLANVQGLIDYEPALAKRMLDAFTDYLRASLLQMRAKEVSLAQEVELVQSYLTVMQCRMGKRLRIEMTLPESLNDVHVPPLLLQPLVENAIHHGLEPQVQGGQLSLRAWPEGDGLCIEVQDDGVGLAHSQARPRRGNGVALKNIRERLLVAYGSQARLELRPGADDRGTCVTLYLPSRQLREMSPT